MPTKTKEYSLYAPGKLVTCLKDIYSSSPIDGDANSENRITLGTVGIIINGPQPEAGYKDHYQVQFVGNILWWVLPNEIEPYLEKN